MGTHPLHQIPDGSGNLDPDFVGVRGEQSEKIANIKKDFVLEVLVINKDDLSVRNASVTAEPETLGERVKAEYDEKRQVYFFKELRMGFYKVTVQHPDYVPQKKRVQAHPKPTRVVLMLCESGEACTFRGGTRVPYDSYPELLGVVISDRDTVEMPDLNELLKIFDSLGIDASQPEMASGIESCGLSDSGVFLRTMIARRRSESPLYESSLKQLRGLPFIEEAGPIFRRTVKSLTLFTNRLMVRFRPEVTRKERDNILKDAELELVEKMSFAPGLFLVEADASTGERINLIAEQLLETGRVIYAEPSLFEMPDEDATVPDDFLWPECWDRKQVRVEEAWEYLGKEVSPDVELGSPDIIIAVIDNGIASDETRPLNEDFTGIVSNGKEKTYKLFDFRNMVANHRKPAANGASNASGHGTSCAGVALARANDKTGVAGAAPNSRLMGLIFPNRDEEKLRMFQWAAGLSVDTLQPGFPERLEQGGDVFTCSIGLGEGAPLLEAVKDALDHLTYRGRKGKGCLVIFSAGNEGREIRIRRPYGYYDKSFSCAASTLKNEKEVRAEYSNFGDAIDWCAPSSSGFKDGIGHNPPISYAVWTTSVPGRGNVPSFPGSRTKLEVIIPAPCVNGNVIKVEDIEGLRKDACILVGWPGTRTSESSRITDPPDQSTGEIKVLTLSKCHQPGDPVLSGPANHENNFGGTSAAAPLSAGICALVLSANPGLTWVEAREILRETAEKIDPDNDDPRGRWLDRDLIPISVSKKPPFFSEWYGHGRLDAFRAVKAAYEYRFTRDLMIRKCLNDTGLDPDLAFGDSPDIWVRKTDPAIDPDPLPPAYDVSGPHEDPVRSADLWIYARVKNLGAETSLDAWVRFYVALTDDLPIGYPEGWHPKNGAGNLTPDSWEPGAYFIGEVQITGIAPGMDETIHVPWPEELIPPASAAGDALIPLLLVEILPLDGPNNNLAQRVISISQGHSVLRRD